MAFWPWDLEMLKILSRVNHMYPVSFPRDVRMVMMTNKDSKYYLLISLVPVTP